MVSEDLDPTKNDAFKEAMVQYVIETSLHGLVGDIIETNLGVETVKPRPMFEANAQAPDVESSGLEIIKMGG